MRFARFTALLVATVLFAGIAFAQGNPTATLTGRVINEGQGLPGVTVNVKSPSLQGTRTAITSVNGDFVLPILPAGDYTVTFTMSGFQTVTRQIKLSAAQTTPVQTPTPATNSGWSRPAPPPPLIELPASGESSDPGASLTSTRP